MIRFFLFLLGLSYLLLFLYLSNDISGEKGIFGTSSQISSYIFAGISFGAIFFSFLSDKKNTLTTGSGEEMESEDTEIQEYDSIIKKFLSDIQDKSKYFFSEIVYILSIMSFYISLYFGLSYIFDTLTISKILFFVNIGVLFFSLFEKKFYIFSDLLRLNTIIIGIFYTCVNILVLFGNYSYSLYDFGNVFGIGILFYIFLYSSQNPKYISFFQILILSFSLLELYVIFFLVFQKNSFEYISFFTVGMAYFFSFFTQNIHTFTRIRMHILRAMNLILLILSFLFCLSFIQDSHFFKLFPLLIFYLSGGILFFLFHQKFENYISLLFGIFSFIISTYIVSLLLEKYDGIFQLFFPQIFLLSFIILGYRKIGGMHYEMEKYILHICSFFVNLIGVIGIFFFYNFSILLLTGIFFFESVYLYFSYYLFKQSQKGRHMFTNFRT